MNAIQEESASRSVPCSLLGSDTRQCQSTSTIIITCSSVTMNNINIMNNTAGCDKDYPSKAVLYPVLLPKVVEIGDVQTKKFELKYSFYHLAKFRVQFKTHYTSGGEVIQNL